MTPEPTPAGAPLPDVTLPPGYHLAVLGPQDEAAVLEVDSWAFAFELPPDVAAGLPYPLEPGRTVGVRAGTDDDAPLVAVHTSYAFTGYPVPGGRVDAAGLSWVAVLPHHRRRGLARAMVLAHLARTRARGEALSVLFAAEPDIYGRFGYGCAAYGTRLTVPRGARLRDVPADVELDVRELGAVYLGGVGLGALAAAGLVRERTPGAAAAAATAFGWPLAPVCDFIF